MRISLSVLTLSLFAVPAVSLAAPYGTAGCGLGSIVFGNDQGIVQIFAATTNGTSASQTFGITSGTSNCVDAGAMSASVDQEAFLKVNYASVMRDTAKGDGEFVDAFAAVLGCTEESHERFAEVVKTNYGELFTKNAEAADVLENAKRVISSDVVLASSCSRATI